MNDYPRLSIVISHGETDTIYTLAVAYNDSHIETVVSLDAREWNHSEGTLRKEKA